MPKTKRKSARILALDPGTRYWGIAVFKGDVLHVSTVKVLKASGSPAARLKEARETFSSLLEDHSPTVFVIEKPFFFWSKQAHLLDNIVEEIKSMVGKRNIKYHEYSPRTVRKVVCGNGNTSKKDMARFLSLLYPELRIRLNPGKKYKELYWGHMFDAVGLGMCYLKRTDKEKGNHARRS